MTREAFLLRWFVNENNYNATDSTAERIDWIRAIPFILVNLGCLLIFYVGFSWTAFTTAAILLFFRLFFIGGFYHRYFSHKTYETNRFWQFIFALMSGTCMQRGPLWWASHHRQHHMVSDEPADAHSPVQHGFWWSHIGWFLSKKNYTFNEKRVKDLMRYPELIFLDRYDVLMPLVLLIGLFTAGVLLHLYAPALNTGPGKMIVWGFCISTIALFHCTVTINSLSHVIGRKRYQTKDNSRNNWLLALVTLGEGWHNNHHHYPAAARQGFMWWEIDITYYMLKFLEKIGIIWNVKGVPQAILKRDLFKP